MKSKLLYAAMFLIILCLPFRGNEHEVHWLWADLLWLPFTLIVCALLCIGLYQYKYEAMKSST